MKGVPVRRAAAVASDVERNRRIDEAVAAALSRTQGLKIGKPWPMGEEEAIYPEPKTRRIPVSQQDLTLPRNPSANPNPNHPIVNTLT